jgi:hypothetical protein
MNSNYLHVAIAHPPPHLTINTVPDGDESLSNKRVALAPHPVGTVPRGDESLVDLRVALAAHHLALDTVAARA